MSLDTRDKEWIYSTINVAIDKSHKLFQKDTERYIGILMEKYREDMKLLVELTEVRPTREEVVGIVREEVRPIREEMSIFKEEMIALRRDFNSHVMSCS